MNLIKKNKEGKERKGNDWWREPPCTVVREAFPGTPLERRNPTLTVGAGITVGNKEIRNSDLTN